MLNTTILLHANILYAEIPLANIPKVVENSYLPVMEIILKNPKLKVVLNFSGFTLEVLNGEHPQIYKGKGEIISLLKEAIEKKQVELTGTSWAHAVLPLIPEELIKKDIELHKLTTRRILNYNPTGFFPPELGISPLLPRILKELGYKWSFFDKYFIELTENGYLNSYNDFEPMPASFTKETAQAKYKGILTQIKHMKSMNIKLKNNRDFHPIIWQGASENNIIGICCDSVWMTYSLICLSHIAIMNEKKLFKTIDRLSGSFKGLFMPYSSDIEFYGYGGNTVKDPVPVSRLDAFFKHLCEKENLYLVLPSEYLSQLEHTSQIEKEIKSLYLKSGSWSSDKNFDLWNKDADNEILNKLSMQAFELYKKNKKHLNKKKMTVILKDLLLSFNSDGRGWTPLSEHRLFCFNKALSVISRLENVKNKE